MEKNLLNRSVEAVRRRVAEGDNPTTHALSEEFMEEMILALAPAKKREASKPILNYADEQYHNLLQHIMDHGVLRGDRTGTGTLGVFGYQMRFDLQRGFPLLTTKKVFTKAIIHELLWFLKGETNIGYLKENDVKIWDEWADENGDLGPVYGSQWRSWSKFSTPRDDKGYKLPDGGPITDVTVYHNTIDQIANVIKSLKENPNSRRHLVTAWNPAEVDNMALPPCHCLFQFYVSEGKLSCQLYQRSADTFLGVPFNIASYALLTHMVAQVVGLEPGEFIHTLGDAHIYCNHYDQVNEQLSRGSSDIVPHVVINPKITSIDSFKYEDISVIGYSPAATISAPISV